VTESDINPAAQRLRQLHTHAREAVAIVDFDLTIHEANPAMARLLAVPVEAINGCTLNQFLRDNAALEAQQALREAEHTGVAFFETALHNAAGVALHVAAYGSAMTMNGRLMVKMLMRDVTASKQAVAEIEKVNRRVVHILESTTDAYIALDHALRVTYINTRGETLFETERERVRGQRLWDLFPELVSAFYRAFQAALTSGEPVVIEGHYAATDKWLEVHLYPHVDGLSAYLRDVTARRAAEQQLRSLARFPDENPSPVMRISSQGVLMYSNAASKELLQEWLSEVGQQVPASIRDETIHALAARVPIEFEVRAGNHVYAILLSPAPEGDHVNAYGRDITARVQAEEQLRLHRDHLEDLVEERTRDLESARDEAQQANRAKSAFLANMSHELRTPLNAIIGYTELLQEEADETSQTQTLADLNKIHTAATHLLRLINDVLDLSKIEAGRMQIEAEEFAVGNLVASAVSTVQPLARANQNRLLVECAEELGMMISDGTRLRQCLLNLLSNACKFTHNGTVTLSVSRTQTEGEDWLQFRIADTGLGMNAEQRAKLFEAFSQVHLQKDKFGGTGLGLALTRHLCRMMGGDVTVDSQPGQGSQFTIHLPAVAPQAHARFSNF